jgi:hypothetical protein
MVRIVLAAVLAATACAPEAGPESRWSDPGWEADDRQPEWIDGPAVAQDFATIEDPALADRAPSRPAPANVAGSWGGSLACADGPVEVWIDLAQEGRDVEGVMLIGDVLYPLTGDADADGASLSLGHGRPFRADPVLELGADPGSVALEADLVMFGFDCSGSLDWMPQS